MEADGNILMVGYIGLAVVLDMEVIEWDLKNDLQVLVILHLTLKST